VSPPTSSSIRGARPICARRSRRSRSGWAATSPQCRRTPRYLRERLAGFQPAAADVTRKRLQNVRSAVAFALDRYGLGGRRSFLAPLSPAAQALYDRLPDKYFRCALSRFLHFISAQGIAPDQVTDAVAQAFLTALQQHFVHQGPARDP
jgi:hypothetical protein